MMATCGTQLMALRKMRNSSDTVVMMDTVWGSPAAANQLGGESVLVSPSTYMEAGKVGPYLGHRQRASCGFADGHAKSMTGEEMHETVLGFKAFFKENLAPLSL